MPVLVLLVLLAAAVAFIAASAVRFRLVLRLLDHGLPVPGEVVEFRAVRANGTRLYTPVVRYRTADGQDLVSAPGRWTQVTSTRGGGAVTVRYDPAQPSRILVEGAGVRCSRQTFLGAFLLRVSAGVVIAVVGVIAYLALSG
jgi:hypothetical protein